MLKDHWLLFSRLTRLFDNVLIVAGFFATYHFRDVFVAFVSPYTSENFWGGSLGPIESYFIVLGVALPSFNATLSLTGAYQRMRFISFFYLARVVVLSSIVSFFSIGTALYLLKLDLSRSFVALYCVLCAFLLFAGRFILFKALRYLRKNGKNYRNVLIVGTGELARKLYNEIVYQPELGVKVVGFVSRDREAHEVSGSAMVGRGSRRHPLVYPSVSVYSSGNVAPEVPTKVIGGPDFFEIALKKYAVDEVLFTEVDSNMGLTAELVNIAVEEGVRVTLAADFFGINIMKSEVGYLGNVPLIHYNIAPAATVSLLIKRLTDIAVSLFLLVVLSPVFLLIALAIKLDSRGPILFRQERVGLNGRKFVLCKFRSMVYNAESMLAQLRQYNEMEGPVFKLTNDPRITRVGKFLRRISLDELPQLLHVLKGDMSLVGPRPPLPQEVTVYRRDQRRRLSMRPGLTCIWQVSGRNNIPSFEEWAQLDLEYIDTWSLWNDFKLIVRTIPAVLLARGAR